MKFAAKTMRSSAPGAFLISAAAPTGANVMIFLDELNCERNNVRGFCINGSHRFRCAPGQALGTEPSRTFGLVMGEQGEAPEPPLHPRLLTANSAARTPLGRGARLSRLKRILRLAN